MPWCEQCSEYRPAEALKADGGCPACDEVLAEPRSTRAPWHFKLLVVAITCYLGWRGVQGVTWLVHHL